MGTSYLPITQSWKEYIVQAEEMYEKVTGELKESLMKAAEDVLKLMPEEKYVYDVLVPCSLLFDCFDWQIIVCKTCHINADFLGYLLIFIS